MNPRNNIQSISPKKVIRGELAWQEGKESISKICNRPLLLGKSIETENIRKFLIRELNYFGLETKSASLTYDCCELDLKRIYEISKKNKCDCIIATGGGKVLDAGKLLSKRLDLPSITIPLSAATCAGWTALSNIYSPNGEFIKDEILNSCPELLIFDHGLVRQAPSRTLASGIADALAKWYEASLTSSSSEDGLVQQAVQMARVLRDQLLIDGYEAFTNPKSDAWARVAEGCALTAGIIGGLGGSKCRTAVAHPLHNGLTQLKFAQKPLHGELVGFGVIIQLHIESSHSKNQLAQKARIQLTNFLKQLRLPINIESIGLNEINIKQLKEACIFACKKDSDIHQVPFNIDSNQLLDAVLKSIEVKELSTKDHLEYKTI